MAFVLATVFVYCKLEHAEIVVCAPTVTENHVTDFLVGRNITFTFHVYRRRGTVCSSQNPGIDTSF